jgi:hypothetical protein
MVVVATTCQDTRGSPEAALSRNLATGSAPAPWRIPWRASWTPSQSCSCFCSFLSASACFGATGNSCPSAKPDGPLVWGAANKTTSEANPPSNSLDFLLGPLETLDDLACVFGALRKSHASLGQTRLRLRLQLEKLALLGVEMAGSSFCSSAKLCAPRFRLCTKMAGKLPLTSAPARPCTCQAESG